MSFSYLHTKNTTYQDYFSSCITNNKTIEHGKVKDCSNTYAIVMRGSNSAQTLAFSRSSIQLCMMQITYAPGLFNQKNPQAADTPQLLDNRKLQIAAQADKFCLFIYF